VSSLPSTIGAVGSVTSTKAVPSNRKSIFGSIIPCAPDKRLEPVETVYLLISAPAKGFQDEPIMANMEYIADNSNGKYVAAFDRAGEGGLSNFDADAEKFEAGDIGDTKWAASYYGRISGVARNVVQNNKRLRNVNFVLIDGGPVTQWEHKTLQSPAFRKAFDTEMSKFGLGGQVSTTVVTQGYEAFLQTVDHERIISSEPILKDLQRFHFKAVVATFKSGWPWFTSSSFKAKVKEIAEQDDGSASKAQILRKWQAAIDRALEAPTLGQRRSPWVHLL
jgi:hypothetical protein